MIYDIWYNDNAFLICIDMWWLTFQTFSLGIREPVRDNWENNFGDNWIVLGSNESSSWFYINYDRHLFFSPFLFLFFFYPLPLVFLFLLVIIYAYHYQSVRAILKFLGPLSRGHCFCLRRSPGDDHTLCNAITITMTTASFQLQLYLLLLREIGNLVEFIGPRYSVALSKSYIDTRGVMKRGVS